MTISNLASSVTYNGDGSTVVFDIEPSVLPGWAESMASEFGP